MKQSKALKVKSIELVEWFDQHHYFGTLSNGELIHGVSVTTHLGIVNKPHFNRWRGDVGNQIADLRMKEAARSGSMVHYACNVYAQGGDVIYNPPFYQKQNFTAKELHDLTLKAKGNICILENQADQVKAWAFERFIHVMKPKILHIEMQIMSLKHGNGGTLDYAMTIQKGTYNLNGGTSLVEIPSSGVWIVDIKTGSESGEHLMQVSEYGFMFEEQEQKLVEGAIILYLNVNEMSGQMKTKCLIVPKSEMPRHIEDYLHAKALWEREHPNDIPIQFKFPAILNSSTAKKRMIELDKMFAAKAEKKKKNKAEKNNRRKGNEND